jgi:hypothetical protein
MNIELSRIAPLEIELDTLHERLLLWAEVNGFSLAERKPGRWEFQRGNPWRLLYSFGLRAVPTRVVVLAFPHIGKAACTLRCASWLSIETAGDRESLEEVIDSLVASVCKPEPRRLEWFVQERGDRRPARHRDESPDAYAK